MHLKSITNDRVIVVKLPFSTCDAHSSDSKKKKILKRKSFWPLDNRKAARPNATLSNIIVQIYPYSVYSSVCVCVSPLYVRSRKLYP